MKDKVKELIKDMDARIDKLNVEIQAKQEQANELYLVKMHLENLVLEFGG